MIADFVTVAITFWAIIAIIVIANGFFVYRVRMARYRVLQTLADKNQPVPPELFSSPRRSVPIGLLRGAVVLICIGFGLTLFFWSMTAQSYFHGPIENAEWLPTLGVFPFMIGLALLLLARLERGRPQ